MKSLNLQRILGQIGGEVVRGKCDITVKRVGTRLKSLKDNTLLFDLWGKKKPSPSTHRRRRFCAIITGNPGKFTKLGKGVTIIKVTSVRKAYWDFIRYYRSLFAIPVIGITGTCGKTTTKDMVKHILETKYNVLATHRSRNDSVYNLKYLMGIDDSTEAAVIEMGVAWTGDLLRCCRYFKPEVGVITRIGVDHLLGCKSLDGYIKAKSEILEGMSYTGTLILNADDENIKKIDLTPFKGKILYFGFSKNADFRASNAKYYRNGMKYTLHYGRKSYRLFIPGLGVHNVYNALAAIAAVHAIGFDVFEAGKLLSSFEHLEHHVQIRNGFQGCTVIDDTWSANPTSLEAALEVLKAIAGWKKKIIVLGGIAELGEHSHYYHSAIGEKIARLQPHKLVTVGDRARIIAKAALENGMNPQKVNCCKNPEEVFDIISPLLNRRSVVLVKKSMRVSFNKLMRRIIAE